MKNERQVLTANKGIFQDTWKNGGFSAVMRKIWAAAQLKLPIHFDDYNRVSAFYDLVTDEARLFYGDNFHFGLFTDQTDTVEAATNALTDLMGEMAVADRATNIIDLGCGICAPAIRMAQRFPALNITGININNEQVRQARVLIAEQALSGRITVEKANALVLPFESGAFDSALSLEVATNICAQAGDKQGHVTEIKRVLALQGRIGFCDLVFHSPSTPAEDKILESVFFHRGKDFIADWPSLFEAEGFRIEEKRDILSQTHKTWELMRSIYEQRGDEVNRRYGKKIANEILENLSFLPEILDRHAEYLVLSATRT
jgi:cyclopropane fatty-acyl-phospholipid synthase-like methyltransferase